MTRKTKREIEREIAKMEPDHDPEVGIAIKDPETGELYDTDGEPLPDSADPAVVFGQAIVMRREDAEREDETILGPADTPADGFVLVEWDNPPWDPV